MQSLIRFVLATTAPLLLSLYGPLVAAGSGCAQQRSSGTARNAPSLEFQAGLRALEENNFELALQHLTLAEQSAPIDARVHNFRAIALTGLERNDEASAEFENAIRLDPKLEDAYRGLGFLEWTRHQLSPAAEHLQKALTLSGEDGFAHYYLGRVLLEQGATSRALGELALSRDLWPSDPAFLIQIGSAYLSAAREADARNSFERAADLSLTPKQTAQLASLLATAHDAQGAAALLQKYCSKREPNPPEWAQFNLALAYLKAGDYEQAASAAQAYLTSRASTSQAMKNPRSSEAWSIIGISAARRGEGASGLEALWKEAQLNPGREEPWLNLTFELMALGDADEAVSATQSGLASLPQSYALHLRLGAAYLAATHYREAEQVFRELAGAGDPLPLSYVGLAQVLLRTGRADEAASELLAAQQKIGDNFLTDYFRGLALERAGKPTEALGAYRRAVTQNPGSVEAHLGVAKTELKLNYVTDCITQLQEVLRLDPSNLQAVRLLSQAYRRKGDAASAAKYANKTGTEADGSPDRTLLGDFILPEWMSPDENTVAR